MPPVAPCVPVPPVSNLNKLVCYILNLYGSLSKIFDGHRMTNMSIIIPIEPNMEPYRKDTRMTRSDYIH